MALVELSGGLGLMFEAGDLPIVEDFCERQGDALNSDIDICWAS